MIEQIEILKVSIREALAERDRYKAERDELIKVINSAVETIYDSAIGSGCVAKDLLEASISRIKEE